MTFRVATRVDLVNDGASWRFEGNDVFRGEHIIVRQMFSMTEHKVIVMDGRENYGAQMGELCVTCSAFTRWIDDTDWTIVRFGH